MSVLLKKAFGRRELLRGTMGGAAITVALPFLDCFLDNHGTALASGAPIPVRFGTWFWAMGHTPGHAVAERTDKLEFLEECQALTKHIPHLNYFGHFNSPLDGRPNHVHHSGWVTARTGVAPALPGDIPAPTLDVLVSDAIGGSTRFRSVDVTCTGNPRDSFTARNTHSRNAGEASPLALYQRLFGPEFADPNSAEFKPDPDIMLQQSVLTGINDQRKAFEKRLGAADKARVDEYFTSIRQLENQLALQLQKPAAAEACTLPKTPDDLPVGYELPMVMAAHDAHAKLLALALACNQTRVFNLAMSNPLSSIRRPGTAYTHHTLTHEEAVDKVKGYQPEAFWFQCRMMEALSRFIDTFAAVREGSGTLLDHTLIFAHAETSYAKIHAVDNIPIFAIGTAGGRLKTGRHVVGNGDPISRVGLTMMQVMGLPIEKWGTGSLQTSKPITEILA
ncbi:MAG: DUF1552 domain-containing protein [Rhodospirillaceae bacterium]|nr:DUF1552 domain-containing protein [Rhodospirillaceae bacterium]